MRLTAERLTCRGCWVGLVDVVVVPPWNWDVDDNILNDDGVWSELDNAVRVEWS